MRTAILNHIKGLGIKGFGLSTESPYDENGTPLYIKNPKRIYVSDPSVSTEPFIGVMGSRSIYNETTTVNIYLAADAKNTPSNFAAALDSLKSVAYMTELGWFQTRESNVTVDYDDDLAVAELTITLSRLT